MQFAEIFEGQDRRRLAPLADDRGHRHAGEDRLLRAHGPPARADRDGAHGRGRDHQVAARALAARLAACSRPTTPLERARGARSRARRPGAGPGQRHGRGRVRRSLARWSSPRGCAADRWFCWEQPDRDGFALGGARHRPRGRSRAARAASPTWSPTCTAVTRDRLADEPDGLPAGAGPVWIGGFAFAADGGRGAALVVAPAGAAGAARALAAAPRRRRTWLTLARSSRPATDRDARARAARAPARLAARGAAAAARPAPDAARRRSPASRPPARYEDAVAAARRADPRRRAREGRARPRGRGRRRPRRTIRRPLFGALRELFPSCFCFCVGTPEARVHRRQPRAARPPQRRRRRDRRARRLDPPQRRPRGRRPPRRAAAAQRQGPRRAPDRRPADRARARAALGLGRGRRRARA